MGKGGGKRGKGAAWLLLQRAAPWVHPYVTVGTQGPSLLPERSCRAQRVKVDSFIHSDGDYPARRAQQHQQPVLGGVCNGKGRNGWQGGGGWSCSPWFPITERDGLGRRGEARIWEQQAPGWI